MSYSMENKKIQEKKLFEEESPAEEKDQKAGAQEDRKNARWKHGALRFYACAAMALFVAIASGWGICQLVRAINEGEEQQKMMAQPGEQVEDNSANEGKAIDVDKMITRILDRVTFEAELNPLEESVASGMIDVAEGTDLRIYMGNGTYSDELVVMTALSESDAKQNQRNVEKHILEMQRQFEDYIPKEAKKIDSAVKVRCGCYVVVCITNDSDTAQKTINAFFKNK